MRWTVVLFLGWLTLGLDAGLRGALAMGSERIAPLFTIPLIVFVALSAPALHALWAAFLLGLMVDLTSPRAGVLGTHDILIGPHALGYMAAAYLVLTVRGVMIRKSLVTLVIMSVLGAALESVVATTLLFVKSLYAGSFDFSPGSSLIQGVGSAVCTAFSAALMGLLLIPGHSWFKFVDPVARRYGR